jgi:hypothetical protein
MIEHVGKRPWPLGKAQHVAVVIVRLGPQGSAYAIVGPNIALQVSWHNAFPDFSV